MTPRLAALTALTQVLGAGHSLSVVLPKVLETSGLGRERALTQSICYGVLRWLPRLELVLAQLLAKPLRERDLDVRCALLIGLYELGFERSAEHAAVNEAVEATRRLGKPWATKLVNAVLRRYLRERDSLDDAIQGQPVGRYAHPEWLIRAVRSAWPDDWQAVLAANNVQAPLSLRVNARRCSREAYLAQLERAGLRGDPAPYTRHGITLERAVPVQQLPGFDEGLVSVQDPAAQLAAPLLAPQRGERVLDACAAPGGKTAHLLEIQPDLAELVAVDIAEARLARVGENLSRLRLGARLIAGDAGNPASWWDGEPFDRILLDAPCSATGVIRRHPDIKSLRRPTDIEGLVATQAVMLDALWPLVKPGGMVLYVTCSILPAENNRQVRRFLTNQAQAQVQELVGPWGRSLDVGRQILPGEDNLDGFYYCLLRKQGP